MDGGYFTTEYEALGNATPCRTEVAKCRLDTRCPTRTTDKNVHPTPRCPTRTTDKNVHPTPRGWRTYLATAGSAHDGSSPLLTLGDRLLTLLIGCSCRFRNPSRVIGHSSIVILTMSNHTSAAIVTGSSRGIGRAIALQLAQDGYSVIVNFVSRPDAADKVVTEISASGGRAVAVGANVGVTTDRAALIQRALDQFGRLDVLVNNAGITSPGRQDLLEVTEESWDTVLATNLKGPLFLSQLAANKMIELIRSGTILRGKIINISSISAYTVSQNRADYCIAKAGMQMMTWLLASRLAEEKIDVFEVCPGVIATDMTAPVKQKYDKLIAEGLTPQRRWGQPEDVAKAVSALVADVFPFCTGDRINVDGGFHIRRL